MTEDVKFSLSGTNYEYMLAPGDGNQKRWAVRHLFMQPPHLLEHKIDMTIRAAASIRDLDNTVYTTRTIATVLAELRTLTDGDTITLVGYDGATYTVTFDPDATYVKSVIDEGGRITEWDIDLSVWDLTQ